MMPQQGSVDEISPMAKDMGVEHCKRTKLSGDERLNRNRERNRLHARKTRERKRNQTSVLQNRISELREEGARLRQLVDEQYTASSLLGLGDALGEKKSNEVKLVPSSQLCNDYYADIVSENGWMDLDGSVGSKNKADQGKRVRRSGKYTPQERERIRRERNRMHAKKTRDRKKFFMESSDRMLSEMQHEASVLREYLRRLGVLSAEEVLRATLRDAEAEQEIASFKTHGGGIGGTGDDDAAGEEGEDEDGDDDHDSSAGETEEEEDEEGEADGEAPRVKRSRKAARLDATSSSSASKKPRGACSSESIQEGITEEEEEEQQQHQEEARELRMQRREVEAERDCRSEVSNHLSSHTGKTSRESRSSGSDSAGTTDGGEAEEGTGAEMATLAYNSNIQKEPNTTHRSRSGSTSNNNNASINGAKNEESGAGAGATTTAAMTIAQQLLRHQPHLPVLPYGWSSLLPGFAAATASGVNPNRVSSSAAEVGADSSAPTPTPPPQTGVDAWNSNTGIFHQQPWLYPYHHPFQTLYSHPTTQQQQQQQQQQQFQQQFQQQYQQQYQQYLAQLMQGFTSHPSQPPHSQSGTTAGAIAAPKASTMPSRATGGIAEAAAAAAAATLTMATATNPSVQLPPAAVLAGIGAAAAARATARESHGSDLSGGVDVGATATGSKRKAGAAGGPLTAGRAGKSVSSSGSSSSSSSSSGKSKSSKKSVADVSVGRKVGHVLQAGSKAKGSKSTSAGSSGGQTGVEATNVGTEAGAEAEVEEAKAAKDHDYDAADAVQFVDGIYACSGDESTLKKSSSHSYSLSGSDNSRERSKNDRELETRESSSKASSSIGTKQGEGGGLGWRGPGAWPGARNSSSSADSVGATENGSLTVPPQFAAAPSATDLALKTASLAASDDAGEGVGAIFPVKVSKQVAGGETAEMAEIAAVALASVAPLYGEVPSATSATSAIFAPSVAADVAYKASKDGAQEGTGPPPSCRTIASAGTVQDRLSVYSKESGGSGTSGSTHCYNGPQENVPLSRYQG